MNGFKVQSLKFKITGSQNRNSTLSLSNPKTLRLSNPFIARIFYRISCNSSHLISWFSSFSETVSSSEDSLAIFS